MKKTLIEVLEGISTIEGRICSYESDEIRSEIQSYSEVNDEFFLPEKYTWEVTEINGFAKIVEAKTERDEELRDKAMTMMQLIANTTDTKFLDQHLAADIVVETFKNL